MENQKTKTVCFTGHRQIQSDDVPLIIARLDELIAEIIGKGYYRFLVGGAIGFDTLAAQAVLRAREQIGGIKLIIVQPCRDQESKWREADKAEYQRILAIADEVICLSDHYYNGCMQKRNFYIVDNSALCVAYMKHKRSGSSQTVRMASGNGLTVINLAEEKSGGDYEND